MDSPRIDDATREALIEELADGAADAVTICGRHGMSIEQTAAWLKDPDNTRWLSHLTGATNQHTQMIVSRYRLNVVSSLLNLVGRKDSKPADAVRAATLMLHMDLEDPPDKGPNLETIPLDDEDLLAIQAECYGEAARETLDEIG